MKLSLELGTQQEQNQNRISLQDMLRDYKYKVGEQKAIISTENQPVLDESLIKEGWQAGMVFQSKTSLESVKAESQRLQDSGYEVQVISAGLDDNDEVIYLCIYRKNPDEVNLEDFPKPVMLTSESKIPENVTRLNMSDELAALLYKPSDVVSEQEQISTLVAFGHKIMFQPVGGSDGIYYLASEENPTFSLIQGKTLLDAVKKHSTDHQNQLKSSKI